MGRELVHLPRESGSDRAEGARRTPRRGVRNKKARKAKVRTAHERDLMDLLARSKRREVRVADAIVAVLCRADSKTLAALGLVLEFVARRATRGPR